MYVCTCMDVCMYICMYVYMYACIYVCIYVVCMYVRMYVCMYVWMIVLMCTCACWSYKARGDGCGTPYPPARVRGWVSRGRWRQWWWVWYTLPSGPSQGMSVKRKMAPGRSRVEFTRETTCNHEYLWDWAILKSATLNSLRRRAERSQAYTQDKDKTRPWISPPKLGNRTWISMAMENDKRNYNFCKWSARVVIDVAWVK